MANRYIHSIIGLIFAVVVTTTASAQLFQDGEVLYYRAAYRAKLIPNTEVGEVTVEETTEAPEEEAPAEEAPVEEETKE